VDRSSVFLSIRERRHATGGNPTFTRTGIRISLVGRHDVKTRLFSFVLVDSDLK